MGMTIGICTQLFFLNGKTTNRLIQKKTRTKSFVQPLSHYKEMLQFSETIDPAGLHVKAKSFSKTSTNGLTVLC